ncbi:MAG: DUF2156 domain-containing protein [Candidatus Lokiarchaeota archaeon]|nr:DUF2156 domain-containing protein [Candidatus Lokiarchaeota archaeon]MBD3339380.1 DUF2156 domain-containing protein [Candidatus Lokiarchaeota archaeon]
MSLDNATSIQIKHKSLFDRYFKEYPPQISEFTFTNLFMWREHYQFEYIEKDDHLIIFSKEYLTKWEEPNTNSNNAIFFLPPIGERPHVIMEEILNEHKNAEFNRVPFEICNNLKDYDSSEKLNLVFLEDRKNFDYIYKFQEMKELPGNKHRKNRRWLNKFLESYNFEFNIIDKDLIDKCRELQLKWCQVKDCEDDQSLLEEQKAILSAIDNFSKLNYIGGIICVNDTCVAYTFGELLNPETLVIHIEKAHTQFEGSYQAINNLFLKHYEREVKFVNREQDLGIPGLRKAKESYKPHHLVEKYIVHRNT